MLGKTIKILSLLLAGAALAWASPASAGGVSGVVKPQGLRTPKGILVYLDRVPDAKVDLSKSKLVMDQRNLSFVPYMLPVPAGAKVLFPNNDKVNHNVFSLSLTKKFNLGSYPPGASKTVVFEKPGVVELRCDVHQDMTGYILVLKTPYYALTDEKGAFTIPDKKLLAAQGIDKAPDLPPGKYLVKTWHPKLKGTRALVEVKAGGNSQVTLSPHRGPAGVLYKR